MLPGTFLDFGQMAEVASGIAFGPSGNGGASGAGSSHTLSGVDLGTPAADRYVVIFAHARDSASDYGVSAMTANGEAAVIAVDSGAPSSTQCSTIGVASVPNGSTGDIVVTWNEDISVGRDVGYLVVYGLSGTTAFSTASLVTGTDPVAVTVNVAAGGLVLAAYADRAENNAVTFLGCDTEIYDHTAPGGTWMSAAAYGLHATAQSGMTVSASQAGGESGALAVATFEPA